MNHTTFFKYIKLPVFIVLILIINLESSAQIASNSVIGFIVDKESNQPVAFVHVININQQLGAVSTDKGKFSMPVSAGDTLVFSAIGYATLKKQISQAELDQKEPLKILFTEASYELNPVNIYAMKTEAEFKKEILEMDLPDNFVELNLPTRPAPDPEQAGVSISGPVSFFYNKFSKEAKQLRKLEDVKRESRISKVAEKKYNVQLVQEITGLGEEEAVEFMKQCSLGDSFIATANEYEIVVAINKCFEEYKQRMN